MNIWRLIARLFTKHKHVNLNKEFDFSRYTFHELSDLFKLYPLDLQVIKQQMLAKWIINNMQVEIEYDLAGNYIKTIKNDFLEVI